MNPYQVLKRSAFGLAFLLITATLHATDSPSSFVWDDFEKGTTFWNVQYPGNAMLESTISIDFPSSGTHCLRGHFKFPAAGGNAVFATQQTGDFTGATSFVVDVYNSSNLTFNGSLVFKQGDKWAWNQSGTQKIVPGWNKNVTFQIQAGGNASATSSAPVLSLPTLEDIREVDLLFNSAGAGDGFLYIDNIRLNGVDPTKVAHVEESSLPTGTPILVTGFEDGTSPFAPETGWSSAQEADVSVVSTTEGTHAVFFRYDNKQPDDKATFSIEADMDLSSATALMFDVYNPRKSDIDAEIYLSTGAAYQYFESSSVALKPGWNRDVTFALKAKTFKCEASKWTNTAALSGVSITKKLGLVFLPHQIAKSFVVVDNVRMLSQDPQTLQKVIENAVPVVPPVVGADRLLEGFEGNLTWEAQSTSSKAVSVEVLKGSTTEGTHFLKASFDFDKTGEAAYFGFANDFSLEGASAIKVDIYNPNSDSLEAGLALKLGDQFDWFESKSVVLKKGWNRDVTFSLQAKTFKSASSNWHYSSAAEPLNKVKEFNIGVLSSGALTGRVYLDNVRVTGGQAAMPVPRKVTHYELKGRPVLWDPLMVPGGDGWVAATGANDNSSAVLLRYLKFQGENVVKMDYRTVSDSQTAKFDKVVSLDWSNVVGVQMDFYNPQSYSVNFTFVAQTGPNFDWQESSEFTLKPGWNRNFKINLNEPLFKSQETNWSASDFLRGKDDIRTVAVVVYPHRAGDGTIYMANLKTIERDLLGDATASPDLGKVVGISSKSDLAVRSLRYDLMEGFEGNTSAWQAVGGAVISVSTSYATERRHSLRMDYQGYLIPNATIPEIQYSPTTPLNLTPYSQIQFDAYNPGPPISASMVFMTGLPFNGNNNGEWIESNSVTIASGWNHNIPIPLLGNNFKSAAVAWKLWDTLRNASRVNQIHLKLGGAFGRGTVYLDNFRLMGSSSSPQQVDGWAGEEVLLKLNPSDAVQLEADGSVMGTPTGGAQFSLNKLRIDVRALDNQLALFTGDQLSGSDDPMQLLNAAQVGNQIFGADERFYLHGLFQVQASAFAHYGADPYSLGNTAGYLLRAKSDYLFDTFSLGLGLVGARMGNVPGSNPLTANVESDIKTYEADLQGYIRDLHLGFHGEVAQSDYLSFPGGPYDLPPTNNRAYYGELDYQIGPFALTATRLEKQEDFFSPFSAAAYQGADQNSGQITWQMDTFGPVKQLQNLSPFLNDFLTGLNFQAQYYDYSSPWVNTYNNHSLRAILKNNNYKPPFFFNFWWYWYDEGKDAGDPTSDNPLLNTHDVVVTSNYELQVQIDPKFLVTGLFRDSYTDYWESFTYALETKLKFWDNTWATGDLKYVNQTGARFGQFTNVSAGLSKSMLADAVEASLTYGAPSFTGYWEDDNNLQTLDQWSFTLSAKF